MAKRKTTASNPNPKKESDAPSSPATPDTTATAKGVKQTTKRIGGSKPRSRRKVSKKAKAKAIPTVAKKPRKGRARRGKRYTPAERAKILAAARQGGLTGAQVAERFGVSTLSYYTWRKKAGAPKRRGPKPGPRPATRTVSRSATDLTGISELVRREVRARIQGLLPQIIESEVASALSGTSSRRSSRR